MGGACREKRNSCRLLVRKPERKRPLESSRHRSLNNIEMDRGEKEWVCVDWIGLAQDMNSSCKCGNYSYGSIKYWETIEWLHNWWFLE
jgi:hypothetical protein